MIGTIPYMSPEQVSGGTRDLDVRSDVYALGVLAYELFAGRPPLELGGLGLVEASKRIQEEEPLLLGRVDRSLRGDLETIVAKALAKDCDRRYGSVAAFADDLGRYLDSQPITARPASAAYQLSRFARRHRAWVAGALAVLLTLLGGLLFTLQQASRARRAELQALANLDTANDRLKEIQRARSAEERGRLRADGIVHFYEDMIFSVVDESSQEADLPDFGELLSAGEAALQRETPAAAIEASIRYTLGRSLRLIGEAERAAPQLERAVDLYRTFDGSELGDRVALARSLAQLGYLRAAQEDAAWEGLLRESRKLFAEAEQVDRESLGVDLLLAVAAFSDLRVDEAEEACRLLRKRADGQPKRSELFARLSGLEARIAEHRGRFDLAEETHRASIALWDSLKAGTAPRSSEARRNYAMFRARRGDLEGARGLLEDALARSKGVDHSVRRHLRCDLAEILLALRDPKAEALLVDLLAEEDARRSVDVLLALARLRRGRGDLTQLGILREPLANLVDAEGRAALDGARLRVELGLQLLARDEEEGLEELRAGAALLQTILPDCEYESIEAAGMLYDALVSFDELEEALALSETWKARLSDGLGADHELTRRFDAMARRIRRELDG